MAAPDREHLDPDPLTAVTGALAGLEPDEIGVLQVLLTPAREPWAESVLRAVTDWDGTAFFADAPEMVALAKAKMARPLFAAIVRVAAQSPRYGRAWEIARALGGALQQFSNPPSNALIPLADDAYGDHEHEEDLLRRQSRRSGMLLNSDELVSLVHLPSVSVRSPKLTREVKRTKPAPAIATGQGVVLGENIHAREKMTVALTPEQRLQHMHVIGASGTGKSTLLLNLIIQDMRQGAGVAVFDPHGDLIDQLLAYVPEERLDDVILLDPADEEHPVGFNILSAHSAPEENLLALTRLDTFLRPKPIRYMVAQRENRLDFAAIMNEGKIFLAKLAQGLIGEENAALLGSLLVAKFQQLAMSRQEVAQEERRPFYVYMDEFQHFVTPSMAAILAGARKYRLGLVLAHQDLRQIAKDQDVLSAVLSNPYTRIVFRVGAPDAKKLEEGFALFDADDLQNLGLGEATCRVERAENDFNLKTSPLPAVELTLARDRRERVIRHSRETYAGRRAQVEALLARERPVPPPAPERPRVRKAEARRAAAPASASPIIPEGTPATPTVGRGGPQHRYLQQLVQRIAEKRGFRAEAEKSVLGGHGQIDVALEGAGCSIACEISVTTRAYHEVQNLTKCLAAGCDYAVLVCADERTLDRARALPGDRDERIRCLKPDELIAFLDELQESRRASSAEAPADRADSGVPLSPEAKKRLLTARHAAAYIGVARQTLAKMRVTGDSPPFYKVGRQVLYDPADLDEWLVERRRESTSDPGPKTG